MGSHIAPPATVTMELLLAAAFPDTKGRKNSSPTLLQFAGCVDSCSAVAIGRSASQSGRSAQSGPWPASFPAATPHSPGQLACQAASYPIQLAGAPPASS